jgi:hypothetical protein
MGSSGVVGAGGKSARAVVSARSRIAESPAADSAGDEAGATPTHDESRVLAMYGEMTTAFLAAGDDCDERAARLDALVDHYKVDVERWVKAQSSLDQAVQDVAAKRIALAAGDRMERARESIQIAMKECSTNEHFIAGLRQLALLNTPKP